MIKISDKFYLSADRFQFIIKEKKIKKTGVKKGETFYDNYAFYPKLSQIFSFMFELGLKEDLEVSDEDITTLKELNNTAKMEYENLKTLSTIIRKIIAEEDA